MTRKIMSLEIDNVMRIKAVSITPGGGVVVVGGANAQGKTSTLDSIAMLIGGKKFSPLEPIRTGEDHAEIKGQLGEFFCTRTYDRTPTGIKSKLIVKDAEGASLKSPQTILDNLVGSLSFDPLEFSRMNKHDAARTLRELVGLDVEQQEAELERVFSKRTEKGREKRAAQAVVDDMPFFTDVPDEPASVSEIGQEIADAFEAKSHRDELLATAAECKARSDANFRKMEQLTAEIGDLEQSIERQRQSAHELIGRREKAEASAREINVPNIEAIQGKLETVEAINEKVRTNEKRTDRQKYAEKIASEWKLLDTEHETIAAAIRKATEAVEYPIEGLELRKEGVYFQGVPFDQGSRAERIKVSLAMGMAMNEEMHVLLIRDGSVLDDEYMRVINEFADARDFQIFVEMARGYENQPGAIIIEDGEVVS